MFVRNHPPAGFGARFFRQRNVDHALAFRNLAADDRDVVFFDLPRLEGFLKLRARLGASREQQTPAGVGVEPMHRHRRPLESALQLMEARGNGIAAAAGRVDGQSGRLVEHDRLGVDEEDTVVQHPFVIARSEATKQSTCGTPGLLRPPHDVFVPPRNETRESSALHNINLFPSDIEWLMSASRPLRAVYALGLKRGSQQCACC